MNDKRVNEAPGERKWFSSWVDAQAKGSAGRVGADAGLRVGQAQAVSPAATARPSNSAWRAPDEPVPGVAWGTFRQPPAA
ncbi:hypothetical protein [Streptomyces atratus]